MSPTVRPVRSSDRDEWVRMRTALWPEFPEDHPREVDRYIADPPERWAVFVAEGGGGGLCGFAEGTLRTDYVEGCATSPVGYLEGIWVDPGARRRRVGRTLCAAVEAWARDCGCREMGSDALLGNETSLAWHAGAGFQRAAVLVAFRKGLAP